MEEFLLHKQDVGGSIPLCPNDIAILTSFKDKTTTKSDFWGRFKSPPKSIYYKTLGAVINPPRRYLRRQFDPPPKTLYKNLGAVMNPPHIKIQGGFEHLSF